MKDFAYCLLSAFFLMQAVPAQAANSVKVNYNSIACLSADDFSRGIELGESGDREAYIAFFTPRIQNGQCVMVQKDEEVFLEDISMFSGTACIRPRGQTDCYTIEYEAIQGE